MDFHTPGGVDRDGWQYAVDFPANYHAKKNFTDYVRRRRWSVWHCYHSQFYQNDLNYNDLNIIM